MAVLEGHMTKLEAVNEMLLSIGETPVSGLDSGLGDAGIAEGVLDRVSREVQLKGWHCNTKYNHELVKNDTDQFPLPVDTLKCDTMNPTSGRQSTTPQPNAYINARMARAADDSKWLMYDADNNTETWTNETTLTVKLVQYLEFSKLTPALQVYIWTEAAHRFQKGVMGSRVLFEYTKEDVIAAEMQAVQEDSENEDLNIIRNNPHVRSVAKRYNPGYNT